MGRILPTLIHNLLGKEPANKLQHLRVVLGEAVVVEFQAARTPAKMRYVELYPLAACQILAGT